MKAQQVPAHLANMQQSPHGTANMQQQPPQRTVNTPMQLVMNQNYNSNRTGNVIQQSTK